MSVRVRFAPSPTGPLHIGGVRTALYNYLFAKKHNGTFILRIEDTDQARYVEGAEAYILNALNWLGLNPDESPENIGEYSPYRQSERREDYKKHVQSLLSSGKAYYAFDTPDELDDMRKKREDAGEHSPKYDHSIRLSMKNSLTLSQKEVVDRLADGSAYTIRLKIDPGQDISFEDEVRGNVTFKSDELDDKILMKSDGWPTYHLANVIDDHNMAITHVIRGEEWLSSTPHHVYLYNAFGWSDEMPTFVHLPLILKPSGKGKLSKRDGAKFGFPVFPLNWDGEEFYEGFRESGFLPGAVNNFLALLGWHPEDDQEIFDIDALSQAFELKRITKSGARFDYDKAKWFNQQYLMQSPVSEVLPLVQDDFRKTYGDVAGEKIAAVVALMVPRVELLPQLISESGFFFESPETYDEKQVRKRWKSESTDHIDQIASRLMGLGEYVASNIEQAVKGYISENELSFGAILPILRIAMTGGLMGPDLFDIFEIVGKDQSDLRLRKAVLTFNEMI